MDEYNRGMDPEVKRYFRKIMNTFSVGLLWLLVIATMGIYFRLAFIHHELHWYNLFFYLFFLVTLAALLWYFYRLWRKEGEQSQK